MAVMFSRNKTQSCKAQPLQMVVCSNCSSSQNNSVFPLYIYFHKISLSKLTLWELMPYIWCCRVLSRGSNEIWRGKRRGAIPPYHVLPLRVWSSYIGFIIKYTILYEHKKLKAANWKYRLISTTAQQIPVDATDPGIPETEQVIKQQKKKLSFTYLCF